MTVTTVSNSREDAFVWIESGEHDDAKSNRTPIIAAYSFIALVDPKRSSLIGGQRNAGRGSYEECQHEG